MSLFCRLGSQWRTGFSGPTGLEYSVLFSLMDRMDLQGEEWWSVLDDIQVLESEALNAMNDRD